MVDKWRPLAEGAAASLRWLAHTLATGGGHSGVHAGVHDGVQQTVRKSAAAAVEPEALSGEALEALTAAVRMAAGASDAGAEAGLNKLNAVYPELESAWFQSLNL